MGVYAAMSIAGAAIGLIAGGLLTSYADWRWVFFVNVPIGLVVVLLAPRVLGESERGRGALRPARRDHRVARPGRPGLRAVRGGDHVQQRPGGLALGRHQGHRVAGGGRGAARGVRRSSRRGRGTRWCRRGCCGPANRTGAYLISLCIGTAMFGMFFFLTIFVQKVWGYCPSEVRDRVPADGRHDHGRGSRSRSQLVAQDRRTAADHRRTAAGVRRACSGCRG